MGGGEVEDEAASPYGDKKPDGSVPAETKAKDMAPWEQHSAVISMPRFDYRAPSSLLQRSHSGFLITCPIKREKSATKEAISILEEYIGYTHGNGIETSEPSCSNFVLKKRKMCFKKIDSGYVESAEGKEAAGTGNPSGEVVKGNNTPSSRMDETAECSLTLSLVKLASSGLVLFIFPNNNFRHTVEMLSNILRSSGSGTQKPSLWCNRIFPIQETCFLIEEDLQRVVSKLVMEYMSGEQEKLERSIKFAVGLNRRGIDEIRMKTTESRVEDSKGLTSMDRDKCFQVVAGAVKAVATKASVDLKSPELVVFVELLPISGVPHGSPVVVGVSVLPHDLVSTKPQLRVKPLVVDSKSVKKRG